MNVDGKAPIVNPCPKAEEKCEPHTKQKETTNETSTEHTASTSAPCPVDSYAQASAEKVSTVSSPQRELSETAKIEQKRRWRLFMAHRRFPLESLSWDKK